jgi:hypothetical protein
MGYFNICPVFNGVNSEGYSADDKNPKETPQFVTHANLFFKVK